MKHPSCARRSAGAFHSPEEKEWKLGLRPLPTGEGGPWPAFSPAGSLRSPPSPQGSLCENSVGVSFRGAAGDEESRIAFKTLRARFLAPFGMTRWMECSHRPQGRKLFLGFSPIATVVLLAQASRHLAPAWVWCARAARAATSRSAEASVGPHRTSKRTHARDSVCTPPASGGWGTVD